METKNDGGFINAVPGSDQNYHQYGMTLRQHYAGLAMQAILTSGSYDKFKLLAVDAYAIADAMITEGEK